MSELEAASPPNSTPAETKPSPPAPIPIFTPLDTATTTTTSQTTSTSVALSALRYDHGSKPNTGDVPPISEWEVILIGKRWIAEDAEGDSNTFKRSELPKPNRVNRFTHDGMRQRDRLNVECDRQTGVVRSVNYG